jgi:hypothetical protein
LSVSAVSGSRRAGHRRARLLRLKGAPITRRIGAPERWPVQRWVLRLGNYCISYGGSRAVAKSGPCPSGTFPSGRYCVFYK